MSVRAKRREPERTVRVVYLIVDRRNGKPVGARLTRDEARSAARDYNFRQRLFTVRRCEVLETRRPGGGA